MFIRNKNGEFIKAAAVKVIEIHNYLTLILYSKNCKMTCEYQSIEERDEALKKVYQAIKPHICTQWIDFGNYRIVEEAIEGVQFWITKGVVQTSVGQFSVDFRDSTWFNDKEELKKYLEDTLSLYMQV